MRLRVDREAALAWLGIECYRPSGRLRPVMPRPSLDPDLDPSAPSSDAPDAADDESATRPAPSPETAAPPPAHGEASVPGPAAPVTEAAPVEPVAEPAPADGLHVTPGSPHRPLAEAIARVANLAVIERGEDCLWLGGERWALSALAGDGQAKRRLWRALAGCSRRPRA